MDEIKSISKSDQSQANQQTCKTCGKEFIRQPGKGRKAKYCSTECRRQADTERKNNKECVGRKLFLKRCNQCGVEYTTYQSEQKYCSMDCNRDAKKKQPRNQIEITCPYCGDEFVKSAKKRKYCSIGCQVKYARRTDKVKAGMRASEQSRRDSLNDTMVRKAIYIAENRRGNNIRYDQITDEMILEKRVGLIAYRERKKELAKTGPNCKVYFKKCKECGNRFTAKNRLEGYCSDECGYERDKRRLRDKYEPKEKTAQVCGQCGIVFKGHVNNSYCSAICRNIVKQNNKPKRRATKLRVYYEPVNPLTVFKRDGWRCQLCGTKLNPKNRGKAQGNAPELDHIIPWAQGGEHSYRNTQCACRKCNGDKGSDELGQLRMF